MREVRYDIGPAAFTVSRESKSVAAIQQLALAALKQHAPAAKIEPEPHMAAAVINGLIHDGPDGVVQVYAQSGGPGWSLSMYRVAVTARGGAATVQKREVSTCVAAGTRIETPSGPVAVENVAEGDQVWAFDLERRQRVEVTVQTIRMNVREAVLTVGASLRLTAEHPVWAGGKWKRADELAAGDRVYGTTGDTVLEAAPQLVREQTTVFDLTVDGPHNFFAGGLLVHNKDRGWSKNLDNAWYLYFGNEQAQEWTTLTESKK